MSFIRLLFVLFVSYSHAADISSPLDKRLKSFIEDMIQGKSIFFLKNGETPRGILISDYKIKEILKEKNGKIHIVLKYTEVGNFRTNENNSKRTSRLHKSPIKKTAKYSFLKKGRKLEIIKMTPKVPLIYRPSFKEENRARPNR
ncbi:MAG: hypothetical protein OXB88_01555 [Bacteriovoracales bacterium]|nr:hypothetical protein [Bacteriovoracales bacterium]